MTRFIGVKPDGTAYSNEEIDEELRKAFADNDNERIDSIVEYMVRRMPYVRAEGPGTV